MNHPILFDRGSLYYEQELISLNAMKLKGSIGLLTTLSLLSCTAQKEVKQIPDNISGIYPRLAYYNNEGECGTGAVVPWANRLWVVTYGPSFSKRFIGQVV